MYRLLESIKCDKGVLQNLPYHQARMDKSVQDLFSKKNTVSLEKIIVPEHYKKGTYKCRVIYSENIENIEFIPYQLPKIQSLKLVFDNAIEYACKFANRMALNILFEKRDTCNEILIVKNGLITDTSMANIILFNGKDWLTPALPLLKGTQRAKLLEEEKIVPANIRPDDIHLFHKSRLINAMMRFEDEVDVEIQNIFQN